MPLDDVHRLRKGDVKFGVSQRIRSSKAPKGHIRRVIGVTSPTKKPIVPCSSY